LILALAGARGRLGDTETTAMLPYSFRIRRVQKTLEWFEQDIPFLNMRVQDLSAERQKSARQFAAAMISQTRAELQRLLEEQPESASDMPETPGEAADRSAE
jgi:hypothetical protein